MSLPSGHVTFSATTGIAAAALYGGRTLHSLLSIPAVGHLFRPLSRMGRLTVERNLGLRQDGSIKTCVLVIDEVSMMSTILLDYVDQRLQEVCRSSAPFGGIAIVLMGDFYQLPPVGNQPLYAIAVKEELTKPTDISAKRLFTMFQLVELTQQMRAAECDLQRSLIANFRERSAPFTKADLSSLRQITSTDISNDRSWLDATIVTAGNSMRHAINFEKVSFNFSDV
eukprot:scpid73703/ scgid6364/ ATP-dependent DNA helicase PIF1; PIF1/RRM3 DNA helicase-like protein